MLSLFPNLITYEQFSPFLIRIVLGAIFIFWSYRNMKKVGLLSAPNKVITIVEGLTGIFLIIGLWTQAAALIACIDLIVRLFGKIQNKSFLTDGVNYYLVMLVLAISLLMTGAGWWAFDIRL